MFNEINLLKVCNKKLKLCNLKIFNINNKYKLIYNKIYPRVKYI